YTSNASIGLNQAQSINLKNAAKWYHNYDGSKYQIDDVNVTVSQNTATFNLGGVAVGYAPNDGYVVFSANVGGSAPSATNNFNTGASDFPLRVGNVTQDSGTSGWTTSLDNVKPGDELKFSLYYHNAGNTAANNAKVTLKLSPSGSSSNFQAESQISATGFNTYTSNASIGLNQAQSINLKNAAKWYHNYDGSKYQIDDVNVTVSGNIATLDLGQVNAGYAPNDGYIIFSATISENSTQETKTIKANAGNDQVVKSGDFVQLNGSNSTGSNLTYSWTCSQGINLNNYNIANPSFVAPTVSSQQSYICALTVSSSPDYSNDSVKITVNPHSATNVSTGTVLGELVSVTENNNGSAVLNGKITECSNKNCKARFIWGENTGVINQTNWIQNLNKGDQFSYPLINLQKGKIYYTGLEIQMGSQTFKTQISNLTKFISKPDKPASLAAKLKNNVNVELSWKLGEGGDKILVKRNINACPTISDLTSKTVYLGEGKTVLDNSLSANTSYCYRAWMVTYDGLQLIYSDPTETLISTKAKATAINTGVTPQVPATKVSSQIEKKFTLESSARNLSLGETQFRKNVTASAGDNIEFHVEVKNTGEDKLENVIVKNLINNDLTLKNIFINNVNQSLDVLEYAFIKELKKGDTFKVNFTVTLNEYQNGGSMAVITEASVDGLNSMTDSVNIQKKSIIIDNIEEETVEASLFSTIMSGQWFPWSILALIILVLLIVYFSLKEERRRK
ncbi:MAG: hypothetical protein PHS04_13360, partial [Tissierellia bacterium]|nr:hypothetical protein [Tissierellia bacterium]